MNLLIGLLSFSKGETASLHRRPWYARVLGLSRLLSVLCFWLLPVLAKDKPVKGPEEEFSQLVTMAPVVVKGQSLAVAVHARSRADRRYGEEFSQKVIQVVYEAVTESTGKGLVIIGAKGEPHPIFVFRKFLELAKAGKLDPELAARAPELSEMMDRWKNGIADKDDEGDKAKDSSDVDLDYDRIIGALPLPLEGLGCKLYQLAWEEKFDEARVEAKLCTLHAADLERRELFKNYNWAFYLPPKGAFNKVIDDLVSEALKNEEVGFFARVMVKGVLLAVKPKIRRVIEAFREGMLFMTVVQARTSLTKEQVASLTDAYVQVSMPDAKQTEGTEQECLVRAVKARLSRVEHSTAVEPEGR